MVTGDNFDPFTYDGSNWVVLYLKQVEKCPKPIFKAHTLLNHSKI